MCSLIEDDLGLFGSSTSSLVSGLTMAIRRDAGFFGGAGAALGWYVPPTGTTPDMAAREGIGRALLGC